MRCPSPPPWGQVGDGDHLRLLVVDDEAEEVAVLGGLVPLPLEEDAVRFGDVGDEAEGLGLACGGVAGFGRGVAALPAVPRPSPRTHRTPGPRWCGG